MYFILFFIDNINYNSENECEVKCTNNEGTLNFSADTIRNQAVIMIRTLVSMCNTLEPLPNDRYINMKLFYYDDITVLYEYIYSHQIINQNFLLMLLKMI